VLPGEAMHVFILKEGKEYNQGVAYLDDGTMVVVDNARRMIGRDASVSVTSVLQTTAGKMIFGRLAEDQHDSTAPTGHNGATNHAPHSSDPRTSNGANGGRRQQPQGNTASAFQKPGAVANRPSEQLDKDV
jgi:hypothetical protein